MASPFATCLAMVGCLPACVNGQEPSAWRHFRYGPRRIASASRHFGARMTMAAITARRWTPPWPLMAKSADRG